MKPYADFVGREYRVTSAVSAYVVAVPGAGLPQGIPVTLAVESDGIPDLTFAFCPLPFDLDREASYDARGLMRIASA